jgi:hypothetical protein
LILLSLVVTLVQLARLVPQLLLQREPLQLVQLDLVQQLQMLALAQLPCSTSQFLVATLVPLVPQVPQVLKGQLQLLQSELQLPDPQDLALA